MDVGREAGHQAAKPGGRGRAGARRRSSRRLPHQCESRDSPAAGGPLRLARCPAGPYPVKMPAQVVAARWTTPTRRTPVAGRMTL